MEQEGSRRSEPGIGAGSVPLRSHDGTGHNNVFTTHTAHSHGDRLDTPPERPRPTGGTSVARKRTFSGGMLTTLAVLTIALVALIVYGILSRRHADQRLETVTVEASVPTVNVIHPTSNRADAELSLPGSTQAYVDTPIYSRTNGYLRQWFFDIGAHVRKGQLMATIETPEIDQQLQVAQADLKSAQVNLDLARITSARYQNLLKSNSVSKQETDVAVGAAAARQAAVEAARAGVGRLQQLQSFEKVYAPFSGIVTARNTDVGALIVAGQESSGNTRELFHLAAIDRLRVYVPLPEASANSIHTGQLATLTTDAYPGRVFNGVVARNANALDPATRTLNVEVDVPNADGMLLPGAYVFVHFPQAAARGTGGVAPLTLPSNTLLFRAEGLRVGIVKKGLVELRPVTIAHDAGATVEIGSGLSPNDEVILDPSDSLANGQPVKIGSSK